MWFLLSLYYLNLFLFKVWSLPSPMWWFSFQIHNQEQHLNGNFILDPMVFLRPYIMMKTMKFQPFMILMKRLVNVSSYISCPSLFEMHEIYIQFSPHMHSANCRNPRSPTFATNQQKQPVSWQDQVWVYGWKMQGVNSSVMFPIPL